MGLCSEGWARRAGTGPRKGRNGHFSALGVQQGRPRGPRTTKTACSMPRMSPTCPARPLVGLGSHLGSRNTPRGVRGRRPCPRRVAARQRPAAAPAHSTTRVAGAISALAAAAHGGTRSCPSLSARQMSKSVVRTRVPLPRSTDTRRTPSSSLARFECWMDRKTQGGETVSHRTRSLTKNVRGAGGGSRSLHRAPVPCCGVLGLTDSARACWCATNPYVEAALATCAVTRARYIARSYFDARYFPRVEIWSDRSTSNLQNQSLNVRTSRSLNAALLQSPDQNLTGSSHRDL